VSAIGVLRMRSKPAAWQRGPPAGSRLCCCICRGLIAVRQKLSAWGALSWALWPVDRAIGAAFVAGCARERRGCCRDGKRGNRASRHCCLPNTCNCGGLADKCHPLCIG
jgi:hypothetical protein